MIRRYFIIVVVHIRGKSRDNSNGSSTTLEEKFTCLISADKKLWGECVL